MTPERLLAHHERVADAPDAVPRMRRFVGDLAVRGKLLPQSPCEVPPKGLPEPKATDQPFTLPSNWRWVRIGDQLELINGMAFKPSDWIDAGLRIVRIQNLNNPNAPFNFCKPEATRERSRIDNGAFLISWSGTPGTSFGAFIWQRGKAVLNQHIFRCDFKTQAFTPEFLRLAINGRLDEMIEKAHGGVGLQHITKRKLEALLIPLPPLNEQHRIVAKVDELMALCDQLEEARAKREATRDRLTAASLARLNTPDPATFPSDARFALEALPALSTRADQIERVRQTIRGLAVRGVLVPQAPSEKLPPSRRRGAPSTAEAPASDLAHSIPSTWSWVRVDEVANARLGKMLDKAKNKGTLRRYLRNVNVRWFDFDLSDVAEMPFEESEIDEFSLRADDVMVCEGGEPGRAAVWDGREENIYFQKAIHRLRFVPESVYGPYFVLALRASADDGRLQTYFTGTGIKHLTGKGLSSFLFPLPPLAEQRRIVAKVDTLMALCSQLEASLAKSNESRRRLLEVLLHEALEAEPSEAA